MNRIVWIFVISALIVSLAKLSIASASNTPSDVSLNFEASSSTDISVPGDVSEAAAKGKKKKKKKNKKKKKGNSNPNDFTLAGAVPFYDNTCTSGDPAASLSLTIVFRVFDGEVLLDINDRTYDAGGDNSFFTGQSASDGNSLFIEGTKLTSIKNTYLINYAIEFPTGGPDGPCQHVYRGNLEKS